MGNKCYCPRNQQDEYLEQKRQQVHRKNNSYSFIEQNHTQTGIIDTYGGNFDITHYFYIVQEDKEQHQNSEELNWLYYLKQELRQQFDGNKWSRNLYKFIKKEIQEEDLINLTLKYRREYNQDASKYQKYNSTESTQHINQEKMAYNGQDDRMNKLRQLKDIDIVGQVLQSCEDQDQNDSNQFEFSEAKNVRGISFHNDNGQRALRLSNQFNDMVLLIKSQLEEQSHPISLIVSKFDEKFNKSFFEGLKNNFMSQNNNPNELMKQGIYQIQIFIKIIFFTTLKFYLLELNPKDIKKDLLINMITSFIIQNEQTYQLIMNLILQGYSGRIKTIQKNMQKYKYRINLEKLGVSKYFHFNQDFKNLIKKEGNKQNVGVSVFHYRNKSFDQLQRNNNIENSNGKDNESDDDKENYKPFENSINALSRITKIMSPMAKLEFIYQVFNTIMMQEIDDFWENVNINYSKLEIDYHNLIGIAIYILLKSGLPVLLADIIYIESFVSSTIMNTNRAYHMTVLQAALEFIEDKLPSYYEDKTIISPLKQAVTPQFIQADIPLSPKSMEYGKGQINFLSGRKQADSFDIEDQDREVVQQNEELLFSIVNNNREQMSFVRRDLTDANSKKQSPLSIKEYQANKECKFQSNSIWEYQHRTRSNCTIVPNAVHTIHKILRKQQIYQKSVISQGRPMMEFDNQSSIAEYDQLRCQPDYQKLLLSEKQREKDLNIFRDNVYMISSFYNQQHQQPPITHAKTIKVEDNKDNKINQFKRKAETIVINDSTDSSKNTNLM